MPEIAAEVASHHLDIKPGYKPVKQKLRHRGVERARAAKEEVDRLLKAGFIRECKYSDWLANVVLVKKLSKKWRMCVDFTDLNKACPKDDYPLPEVGDLMLRKFEATCKIVEKGKLKRTWDRPFKVTRVIKLKTYQLEDNRKV